MNQEMIEMAEEVFNTTSIVLSDQGQISPIFFIIKDGKMNPLVGAPEMDMQKVASIAVNVAHETDAEAIILVCEQMMISMKRDSPELKDYLDGTKRPSESKKAEEYLTLVYMSKTGDSSSLIAKIHHSLNGIRFVRDNQWIENSVTNIITPWA